MYKQTQSAFGEFRNITKVPSMMNLVFLVFDQRLKATPFLIEGLSFRCSSHDDCEEADMNMRDNLATPWLEADACGAEDV